MKNKTLRLFEVALFVVSFFLFPHISLAYNYETHALLTKETVDFFNSKYSKNIPENLMRYLTDGSRREDDVPRWLNHFYDPINNRGLNYNAAIDPSFVILQTLGNQPASKDWAVNSSLQEGFLYWVASKISPTTVASILTAEELKNIKPLDNETNFSWNRALKLYIAGDKEKAMFALGHVIHLIQDASVPDHTRNDPHMGDSPYENYTSVLNLNNSDTNLKIRLLTETPIKLTSLDDGFTAIAKYSNGNFYSKDTIGIQSGYTFPAPSYFGRLGSTNYGFLDADKYGEFPIILNNGLINFSGDPINDNAIQSAYWTRLSTKAVVYGAATIDLFFREAERLKDDPEFNKENKGFLAKITDGIKQAFNNMFNPSDKGIIAEIPTGGEEPKQEEKKPLVFVDKTSIHPEETIIESGSNFTPNGETTLFFLLPSGKIASVKISVDKNGQFNNIYTIHPSAETGLHYYWAEDKTTGIVTDRIKYLIIPVSERNITQEKIAEILTDNPDNKENENKKEELSLQLPKDCSFAGIGISNKGKTIILNEIAWMGSTESSSGEWIELKNTSSSEINISGWWLIDQAEQIKMVFPNNTKIAANRFYLLERGDDDAIPDVKADVIYTGTLSNTKEGLRLLNPDCQIEDEVIANPDWPAGNSEGRKTMERKNNLSGWQTSVFVDGTPKQENSAGTVSQDTYTNVNYSNSGGGGGSTTITYCSQTNLSLPSKEIIINEIAWAGDVTSSSNEWIELYNPNETEVSLAGWQLLDKAADIKVVFGSGDKIYAKGYYLLLRGSENFIPGVQADKFYTGAINNTDETLRLFNISCILVDEVKDTGSNWENIGGSGSPDYKTAEKLPDGSWHSYSGTAGGIMGTPKTENSSKKIGEEEGENEENEGSGSTSGSLASDIVISEIMPGANDNTDDEFIELYNPTEDAVSLDGWSLKRKPNPDNPDSLETLVSKDEQLFDGKIIPPKSFLLIASPEYSGDKQPDVRYSTVSHLANNGDTIIFYNHSNEPASVANYESIESGKSWERKAYVDGICIKATGDYEFLGNGCDTDGEAVWNIRENPTPQNLTSLPEPRDKPTWPSFTSSDVVVSYNVEKIAADVTWPSFTGTARVSNDSGVLWKGSGTEGTKRIKLYELGKEYKLYFDIVDADGLASEDKASLVITPPRFIADYKIFSSVKYDFDQVEEERDILEFSWNEYPFVPQNAGLYLPQGENKGYPNYKVLVFYKNMDVPDDLFLDLNEMPLPEYADNVASVCYHEEMYTYECRSSLVFTDPGASIFTGYPSGSRLDHHYFEDGDKHLAVPLKNVNTSDYLTVGYYAFYRAPVSLPPETFILVAKDNTHITFGDAPIHVSPSTPGNLTLEIQTKEDGQRIIAWWDNSFDPDTPDILMRYEISHDNGATWQLSGSGDKIVAETGSTYTVQVRAYDDFGLYSEVSEASVTIPPLSSLPPPELPEPPEPPEPES